MKIKEVFEYEFFSAFEELKRKDNWMSILSVFAVIFALFKNYVAMAICLIVLLALQMLRDYESGRVLGYVRSKERARINEIIEKEKKTPENQEVKKIVNDWKE